VGACARAIKTMGFHRLILVRVRAPGGAGAPDGVQMSVRAWDVLHASEQHEELASAVSGALVFATSSRRGLSGAVTAREAGQLIVAAASEGRAARILFGNEKTGLSAEEIDGAEYRLRIPMAGDQPSINLAQAVQLVAYEIFVAGLAARGEPENP
jgi:TrmH family RNA methyltransferase